MIDLFAVSESLPPRLAERAGGQVSPLAGGDVALPDWMNAPDDYVPPRGKGGFITRSLHSMLGIASVLHAGDAREQGRLRVNALPRLVMTIMLIVMLSLAENFTYVFILLAYALVSLAFLKADSLKRVLPICAVATGFAFLIMIPAAMYGNSYSMTVIPSKVFVSVSLMLAMAESARVGELISALRSLRVPNIFVFILDITLKYIHMLGELAIDMLHALKLRSVGSDTHGYASLSGVAGTIFLKSREMAEEMHMAMVCRGFTGEYERSGRRALSAADVCYIALHAALVVAWVMYGDRV